MSSKTFVIALLFGISSHVHAGLTVFACEPEWADLVQALVPEANIHTATTAWQDPHYIEARPSLIAALRNSDLAVCTGASLEAGWLPALMQRAANTRIAEGRDGLFYAASFTHLHQPHAHVDRSMGDVHPEGNPHVHLNPEAVPQVLDALAQRIQQVAPEASTTLRAHRQLWQLRWDKAKAEWEALKPQIAGMKVIVQHSGFDYLLRYAGVEAVLDLEPKPGLPPTPAHLNAVLNWPQLPTARAILISPYQDPQPAQWLASRTGLPVLTLPTTMTGEDPTRTLPDLITHILSSLAEHAQESPTHGQ